MCMFPQLPLRRDSSSAAFSSSDMMCSTWPLLSLRDAIDHQPDRHNSIHEFFTSLAVNAEAHGVLPCRPLGVCIAGTGGTRLRSFRTKHSENFHTSSFRCSLHSFPIHAAPTASASPYDDMMSNDGYADGNAEVSSELVPYMAILFTRLDEPVCDSIDEEEEDDDGVSSQSGSRLWSWGSRRSGASGGSAASGLYSALGVSAELND